MIISDAHKFIFVAIPKTGTHSVRRSLREHLGPEDQEQVRLFTEKTLSIPALAALKHGHIALQQLQPHMPPANFDSYFKFAFVRNPFDRFVSFCSFMGRKSGAFAQNPQAVMRHYLFPQPTLHLLMTPQHLFVTDDAGGLLADHLGRVETMQESYDEICGRIGIPSARLERANATERRDYRGYYDPQLIDAVAKVYARDLELFGYDF
jgi:hypothetical protein